MQHEGLDILLAVDSAGALAAGVDEAVSLFVSSDALGVGTTAMGVRVGAVKIKRSANVRMSDERDSACILISSFGTHHIDDTYELVQRAPGWVGPRLRHVRGQALR